MGSNNADAIEAASYISACVMPLVQQLDCIASSAAHKA
jgi:hypothetical protein